MVRPLVGVPPPAGGRFIGAGSPLPFPLRSDLGNLADRHGAGVPARGPTYVPADASRLRRKPLQLGLVAPDDLADPRAIQADKLANVSQRESFLLRLGECLAPRFPRSLHISLKPRLGIADCLAGLLGGVHSHGRRRLCADRSKPCAIP